jgi:hypothetical protein
MSSTGESYTIFKHHPPTFLGEPFYDWRKYVLGRLARYLCARGIQVTVADRTSFDVQAGSSAPRAMPIRDSLAILRHDQTGDYFALDFHDWVTTPELDRLVGDSRCKLILKAQYRAKVLDLARYEKVRPWTYFDRFWPQYEERMVAERTAPRPADLLYYRGADWEGRRPVLDELSRRGVIGADFGIVGFARYFHESASHRVMLSLPGMADVCNRDIECFGRGMCVLRPRMQNQFHDTLIPDHHYVSVDVQMKGTDPIEVADRLERRFREVADDPTFIASIVKHAARWYDDNVRADAPMKLTALLLGFEADDLAAVA